MTTDMAPSALEPLEPTIYQSVMWKALLFFILLITIALGSIGSVLANLPPFLALPILFSPKVRKLLSGQWGIFIFLAVFIVLSIMFMITADEPSDMLFSFNFIALPLTIPAFLLARKHAGGRWPLIIMALVLIGTCLGLAEGLFEIFFRNRQRAVGFANNANIYAHVAILFGMISLVGLNLTKSRWRFLFLLGPFLGILIALLAGSRGSIVAALPLIPIALFYIYSQAKDRRLIFSVGAVFLAIVIGWATFTGAFESRLSRIVETPQVIAEVLKTGESTSWGVFMRLGLYRGAWRAFLESPIVGHGWFNGVAVSAAEITGVHGSDNRPNSELAGAWPHVHNDPLQFAAGAGIFGIACYLALLAAPFASIKSSGKYAPHRLYIALCMLFMTLVHGFFDAPFGYDVGVNTYVFMVAIIAGVFWEPRQSVFEKSN